MKLQGDVEGSVLRQCNDHLINCSFSALFSKVLPASVTPFDPHNIPQMDTRYYYISTF